MSSADAILLSYVEARERLASAPALSMTLHSGVIGALLCPRNRCPGSPRLDPEGVVRCSQCRREWDMERVELGKTEIGGKVSMWGRRRRVVRARVAARDPESRSHRAVRGLKWALEQLAEEHPHATGAWTIHVLDDREILAGRANCLGLAHDHIPGRMAELIRLGLLPPCDVPLTVYRTRKWIGQARRRAVELLEERTLRTLAAATGVRVLLS